MQKSIFICAPTIVAFTCFVLIRNGPVDGRICGQVDVINTPFEMESQLRNCTMVVGSVKIVLIQKYGNTTDFTQFQFPELREITGFLLVFRVDGLRTLRQLFPNLMVIRGDKLVKHYALIIYEMADLNEIGLTSLIKIHRGFVMIRYCPMLCYVQTVDWNAITEETFGNGIGNYLEPESFSACPTTKSCPKTCKNCWNNQHCQYFDTGKSRSNKNVQCHSECIGDCVDATDSGCHVCRNYFSTIDHKCVNKCPEDLYSMGNLCITAEKCIQKKKKPIMGECVETCPPVFAEYGHEHYKECARDCPGYQVDSLSASDLLRGCQRITGDLLIRIQIGNANTLAILERNLGDIEEIDGILKVYRSSAITSLSFLRSLRHIHGNSTSKYSFVLHSNENLQELWNFEEKRALTLDNGNLHVHYNSKLCLNQIEQLRQILNVDRKMATTDDIGPDSNGYEQICLAQSITTGHQNTTISSVEISWNKITISDFEQIIGYIVFYIIAPEQNVTHGGIDACVQYGWQSRFIQYTPWEANQTTHSTILENLQQNTQYAYYVKTQVVAKNESHALKVRQGVSLIKYFTTVPDVPTFGSFETVSKTNVSITLNWYPTNDVDFIEYFKVNVFLIEDDYTLLDERNYCENPQVDMQINTGEAHISPQNCAIEYADWKRQHPEAIDPQREWQSNRRAQCAQRELLANAQNRNFSSCTEARCLRKENYESFHSSRKMYETIMDYHEEDRHIGAISESDKAFIGTTFKVDTIYNNTFSPLLPYRLYAFKLYTCNKLCSQYTFHYERTETSIYADKIDTFNATHDDKFSNQVVLHFNEPFPSNGIVISYNIEVHHLHTSTIQTLCITRKMHQDNNYKYTLNNLRDGHYSLRVRAISLGMTGPYTDYVIVGIFAREESIIVSIVTAALVVGVVSLILYITYRQLRRYRPHRVRSGSRENILVDMEPLNNDDPPANLAESEDNILPGNATPENARNRGNISSREVAKEYVPGRIDVQSGGMVQVKADVHREVELVAEAYHQHTPSTESVQFTTPTRAEFHYSPDKSRVEVKPTVDPIFEETEQFSSTVRLFGDETPREVSPRPLFQPTANVSRETTPRKLFQSSEKKSSREASPRVHMQPKEYLQSREVSPRQSSEGEKSTEVSPRKYGQSNEGESSKEISPRNATQPKVEQEEILYGPNAQSKGNFQYRGDVQFREDV